MCAHYWKIEEARAKQSKGVCVKCGEERMFDNYVESLTRFPAPGQPVMPHQQIVYSERCRTYKGVSKNEKTFQNKTPY